jgi:hypothetical protein
MGGGVAQRLRAIHGVPAEALRHRAFAS